MDLPEYKYQPIDLARDAIRLIRLVEGSDTSTIQCQLLQSHLDRNIGVPYDALSYVWGEKPPETVALERLEVVDEDLKILGYLGIYPNLYKILGHLRRVAEGKLIWIDAICINQGKDYLEERNHQVGQMTLVYENAETVLAWLGDIDPDMATLLRLANELDQMNAPDIDMATLLRMAPNEVDQMNAPSKNTPSRTKMVSIRTLMEQFEKMVRSRGYRSTHHFLTTDSGRMSSAVSRILDLPWFRRTWIIQEVASAKYGWVLGAQLDQDYLLASVPMRTFALLPSILKSKPTEHTQAILDVMPRAGQRRDGWWKSEPDLVTLLRKFKGSKCEKPQDSVYALLGICSDKSAKGILEPDYNLPLDTFLRNTLSYLLFGDVLDLEKYKLPAIAMWKEASNDSHVTRLALLWALENKSKNVALRLLDLEDKPWEHDFKLTFSELCKLLLQRQNIHGATHLGRGFGARTLLPLAMKKDDFESLSLDLLQRYLNRGIADSAIEEVLSASISEGKVGFAQQLLDSRGLNVNAFGPKWSIFLCAAFQKKDTAMSRMLLQRREIQINLKGLSLSDNPLYVATRLGMSDAVELLLQHENFDLSALDDHGTVEILAVAAETGHVRIFESIWSCPGISVDANWERHGQSLLGIAAAQRDGLPMVKLILAGTHGIVDVNRPSRVPRWTQIGVETFDVEMTPLKVAALTGNEDIVRYLLDTQANLDLEKGSGNAQGTALWAAAHHNHATVVKLLLEHGASVAAKGYIYKLKRDHFEYLEDLFGHEDWTTIPSLRSWEEPAASDWREPRTADSRTWERTKENTPLEEAESLGFYNIVEILLSNS